MTSLRLGSIHCCCLLLGWVILIDFVMAAPIPKEKELRTFFVQWVVKEEFLGNAPHNPIFVKDKVVVGTDKGDLRAYRSTDGKLLWNHSHGKRIFHCPTSDGERVYFSSENGVTAVTIEEGSKVWNFDLKCCDGPTLVLAKKGIVYVGGHDGNVYTLDAKTGEKKWTSDFIKDAPADPPNFSGEQTRISGTLARPSRLTSDGETLFLSIFDQCRVVAINATNGERLWSFQSRGWLYGSAVTTSQHVFVGSQDNHYYCLNKKTGKEIWKYKTRSRIESGGVVDDKFVYFGSCDGSLYCLHQSDGKVRWEFAVDLEEDGKKSAIYSVPLLQKGNVYFAAGEGQVYGVDQETGRMKSKIRPSEYSRLYCSLATDGKQFFLSSQLGSKNRGEDSLIAVGLK